MLIFDFFQGEIINVTQKLNRVTLDQDNNLTLNTYFVQTCIAIIISYEEKEESTLFTARSTGTRRVSAIHMDNLQTTKDFTQKNNKSLDKMLNFVTNNNKKKYSGIKVHILGV